MPKEFIVGGLAQSQSALVKLNGDLWRVQGAVHSQGPSGADPEVKTNLFNLFKQNFSTLAASTTLRPLEGPGGPDTVRDHLGPPAINAEIKRNRFSKKNWPQLAFTGLEAAGGSWGPDTVREPQGLTQMSK